MTKVNILIIAGSLASAAAEFLNESIFSIPLNKEHPAIPYRTISNVSSLSSSGEIESTYSEDSAFIQLLENALGVKLELNAMKLPLAGELSKVPWPSSYWPTWQDSINYIWNDGDERSAVKKYSLAFRKNYGRLEDAVSASTGIDSQSSLHCISGIFCRSDQVCAKRRGHVRGRCIATWYGICHAWAPAALLEVEPCRSVIRNGVKFNVQDIKALLSYIYDRAELNTVFTGGRCEQYNPAVDRYGRYVDKDCRDISPGYFHLVSTNLIGIMNQGFVIDRDALFEVWNQPIRGYKIRSQRRIDGSFAMNLFGHSGPYVFNKLASSFLYVKMDSSHIIESFEDGPLVSTGRVEEYTLVKTYEYVLELDAADNIIGGEWVGTSRYDHPDFLWFPTSKPAAKTIARGEISYAVVSEMLKEAAC